MKSVDESMVESLLTDVIIYSLITDDNLRKLLDDEAEVIVLLLERNEISLSRKFGITGIREVV
jgi:hypothetical protein